jgi:hypothetical protein
VTVIWCYGDMAGMVLIDSGHEDQARRLQEDEWWRLGEMRTIALRLRARILGLRCLVVLAGFSELNPQIARDVRQTALAGPPILHDRYPQDAGAVLGR